MGCASSDMVDMILQTYKNEINSAKTEIENLKQKNPNDCLSILFKLMNGKSIVITCSKNTPLFSVFLLLIDKAHDNEYSNINKLKMYYNSINITHNFNQNSNKIISDLNFTTAVPVIHINT